ncbi:MAG TPA: barstar family protein [Mycobacteriales bacterium]|nr:barstar family protein [Mycobacteriales bacterium]
MAAFDPSDELNHPLDYELVQNSFVTMFWRQEILRTTTTWLQEHGYVVVTIDTGDWVDEGDLHRDIAAALRFPDYYGRNFDALNDCLSDVAAGDYGADPNATGFVLVLLRYDRYAARQPGPAHRLLDIFASQARNAALFGHRMMCLVQSDDPKLAFPALGATSAEWNRAEWLNSNRGL